MPGPSIRWMRHDFAIAGVVPRAGVRETIAFQREPALRLGGRLRSSEGEFLKVGRQGDANRLKELTSDAGGRGAQQEALAILLKLDFLQPVEIAQDVVPFGCDVVPVEAILEFLDEQQGKEGAEHVAANRHVAAVVDWASGKHGLGLAEQLLDPQ